MSRWSRPFTLNSVGRWLRNGQRARGIGVVVAEGVLWNA